MKDKLINTMFFVLGFCAVFLPFIAFGSMYQTDAITVFKDVQTGTQGIFMATSTEDRTILSAQFLCSNGTKDNALTYGIGSPLANDNNIIDSEGSTGAFQTFITRLWPINTPIYWNKEVSGDKCNFSIVYVNRNLKNEATTTSNVLVTNFASSTIGTTTVSLDAGYTGLNRLEMLFISAIFLFLLSFGTWKYFSVKPRKYKRIMN